ncbi:ABC transporter substrate-binding protein [Methylobacterium sp. NEAU 140]|uniref:ABC transporter substrate-binding protein n=1 Tax=Methylobacterium sp. NEAU 140 TaxID=3064945 RepID=UPI0027349C1E|nr:ABC transporter substrate-binding protein [Methylobacterium sp. NEAU 140]MDP4024173.1 ABC transporter substrate-binding protein [Methylobacterium sp. NEAU 140]
MRKRAWLRAAVAVVGLCQIAPAWAQLSGDKLKVGVLTDQSSIYSDIAGKGSAVAAKLAIEDFGKTVLGRPIELVVADHQAKVDVGASVAREMFGRDGVDAIIDITHSAVSLAVQEVARDANRIVLHVGSAHADLYGSACSPNGALWLYDTYTLANGMSRALVGEGADTWFFVTADYAFGHSMQAQMTRIVGELGGKVLGSVRHPISSSDFSSYLLQAQASGAKVIGLANAAGDTANAIKQAGEFGITQGGQKLAALIFYIQTAKAIGPERGQGLQFLTGYYWDRDAASRNFAKRFQAEMGGAMPSQIQAGTYSATLHYLRSVAAAGTDDAGAVMKAMRASPVNDFFAEGAMLRADGRLMKDLFLAEMKKPSEVKGPWDLLTIVRRLPAAEIIRPIDQGGCKLVQK